MRRSARHVAVVVTIACTVLLAACSSSPSSTAGSTPKPTHELTLYAYKTSLGTRRGLHRGHRGLHRFGRVVEALRLHECIVHRDMAALGYRRCGRCRCSRRAAVADRDGEAARWFRPDDLRGSPALSLRAHPARGAGRTRRGPAACGMSSERTATSSSEHTGRKSSPVLGFCFRSSRPLRVPSCWLRARRAALHRPRRPGRARPRQNYTAHTLNLVSSDFPSTWKTLPTTGGPNVVRSSLNGCALQVPHAQAGNHCRARATSSSPRRGSKSDRRSRSSTVPNKRRRRPQQREAAPSRRASQRS